MQATQHYRDDKRELSHANTNIPDRGRAAILVPVPTEACTDDLNAVGITDRCKRANEVRIGNTSKSLLTTTITTATSAPAPTPTPTMSHDGFEFAAELAVVGAERLIVVGVGVGEADVEPGVSVLVVALEGEAVLGETVVGPAADGETVVGPAVVGPAVGVVVGIVVGVDGVRLGVEVEGFLVGVRLGVLVLGAVKG
jgi:hypothetical protein